MNFQFWDQRRRDHLRRNRMARDPRARCASALPLRLEPLSIVLTIFLVLSCALAAPAKSPVAAARPAKAQEESAQQLVRDVVWNEIQAQTRDTTLWRFHETQWKRAGRKLYDVIETKYGELQRLLAIDGRPLEGTALQAENSRIRQLSSDRDELQTAQKRRDADARQEQKMLKMLPNAFIFRRVGQDGNVVTLAFTPNPAFHPASREDQVFHHMEGTLLVDGRMKRLLQIDGRLTSPVQFWGGLLGHLDAGGTFKVVQRNVGDGHWDMVYLNVDMSGKALFFKTISVHQQESYSNFQRVPDDLTPEQAARELKADLDSRDFAGE